MKSLIFAALLTAAYGAAVYKQSGEINALLYIGTADRVAYYYDNSTYKIWNDAKQYCKNANMTLASFNTVNQLELLNSTSVTIFPSDRYWTAGRDAHDIRQFSWDDTNLQVPDLMRMDFLGNSLGTNYQTCIYIYKGIDYVRAYMTSCTSRWGTLCSKPAV